MILDSGPFSHRTMFRLSKLKLIGPGGLGMVPIRSLLSQNWNWPRWCVWQFPQSQQWQCNSYFYRGKKEVRCNYETLTIVNKQTNNIQRNKKQHTPKLVQRLQFAVTNYLVDGPEWMMSTVFGFVADADVVLHCGRCERLGKRRRKLSAERLGRVWWIRL